MSKKTDKIRVFLVGALALIVGITMILWAVSAGKSSFEKMIVPLVIAAVIIAFGVKYVISNKDVVKKGMPLEDERSQKVIHLALAKAFLYSLFYLLALGWLSEDIIQFRDVSQAMSAGILGMAVLFGLCWAYYNSKKSIL